MALDPDDLTLVRSYVPWDPPVDATLDARYEVLGSWQAVAVEQLRTRRQTLLDSPSSFSVGGEYSESWTANIEALSKTIDELEAQIPVDADGGGSGWGQAQMVRADRGSRGR